MIIPKILKDQYIVFPVIAGLILIVIGFSIYYLNLAGVPSLLVIHFDSYKGIDFLGDKSDVLRILFFGLVVIGINGILAYELYFRERFFSYLLSFASLVFALLILIATFAIISIN